MSNEFPMARQTVHADEALVQEIIELRARLHQVGLNASDSDLVSLLNNTRKARMGSGPRVSPKRFERI